MEIPENHRSFWVDDMFYSSRKPSEQYGVYVDFFDSVGLMIEIKREPQFGDFYIQINDKVYMRDRFQLRPEARIAAIEKANEIYNERSV